METERYYLSCKFFHNLIIAYIICDYGAILFQKFLFQFQKSVLFLATKKAINYSLKKTRFNNNRTKNYALKFNIFLYVQYILFSFVLSSSLDTCANFQVNQPRKSR